MVNIFIHGLGQTSASWEKTINSLSITTDTYCPDLPKLIQNKEVSYINLYNEFVKYCDKISGSINLCGLSLGEL